MINVVIKKDFRDAVDTFNNELNDYYEKHIAYERPYFGDGAMLEYLDELEDTLNDDTDLTWELGKKTRTGHVASFEPSEIWQKTYLEIYSR